MKCQIGEYCVAGATEPRQQDNRQQASAKHQPTNRGGPKTHLKRKARGHLRTGETVGSGGQDRGCKSNSRELHGLVYGGLVRKKRIERRCCSQPQKAKQWLRFTVEGEERRCQPRSWRSKKSRCVSRRVRWWVGEKEVRCSGRLTFVIRILRSIWHVVGAVQILLAEETW